METTNKKFFVYLRQSKKDNSVYTFNMQRKGVENFAKQIWIKLDLSDKYLIEEEASAYSGNRPLFDEMIAKLETDSLLPLDEQKYGGIFFYNTSRIARNARDFLRIEQIMENGYKIFSATENIIDSAAGMYFFRMMQLESIYYSDRQSSKMQWYNLHILFGNPYKGLGGTGITYGYDINSENIIVPHPVNSKIVRRIFELRQKGRLHAEIFIFLKKEFSDIVNTYNQENGNNFRKSKNTEMYSDKNMDIPDIDEDFVEDEEDDSWKRKNREVGGKRRENRKLWFPAYIPDDSKISEIVNLTWRIRYNGERNYQFGLGFEEDARMQNDFQKSSIHPFRFESWDKFIKWKNSIIFETPKLQIVPKDIYSEVLSKAIKRRYVKQDTANIYSGLLFCSCWGELNAKIEWGYVYYQCWNAYKKQQCERATRITEEKISHFIEHEILTYLQPKKDSEEFIKLLAECKRASIEHIKYKLRTATGNLTKFKTILDRTKDAWIYEEYAEKMRITEIEIRDMESEMQDLEELNKVQLLYFFKHIGDFNTIDRGIKRLMMRFILEKIELDERREEDFIYINPFNRLKETRKPQYQKIVTGLKLTPYLHEFFILNKYHDDV